MNRFAEILEDVRRHQDQPARPNRFEGILEDVRLSTAQPTPGQDLLALRSTRPAPAGPYQAPATAGWHTPPAAQPADVQEVMPREDALAAMERQRLDHRLRPDTRGRDPYGSVIGPHEPSRGEKIREYVFGRPEDWQGTAHEPLTRLGSAAGPLGASGVLPGVASAAEQIGVGYIRGASLGAPDLAWHGLNKMAPDIFRGTFDERLQERQATPFARAAGGVARFIGGLKTGKAVFNKALSAVGVSPKLAGDAGYVTRMAKRVPPWAIRGLVDAGVTAVIEDKEAGEIAREIAKGAGRGAASGATVETAFYGVAKAFGAGWKAFAREHPDLAARLSQAWAKMTGQYVGGDIEVAGPDTAGYKARQAAREASKRARAERDFREATVVKADIERYKADKAAGRDTSWMFEKYVFSGAARPDATPGVKETAAPSAPAAKGLVDTLKGPTPAAEKLPAVLKRYGRDVEAAKAAVNRTIETGEAPSGIPVYADAAGVEVKAVPVEASGTGEGVRLSATGQDAVSLHAREISDIVSATGAGVYVDIEMGKAYLVQDDGVVAALDRVEGGWSPDFTLRPEEPWPVELAVEAVEDPAAALDITAGEMIEDTRRAVRGIARRRASAAGLEGWVVDTGTGPAFIADADAARIETREDEARRVFALRGPGLFGEEIEPEPGGHVDLFGRPIRERKPRKPPAVDPTGELFDVAASEAGEVVSRTRETLFGPETMRVHTGPERKALLRSVLAEARRRGRSALAGDIERLEKVTSALAADLNEGAARLAEARTKTRLDEITRQLVDRWTASPERALGGAPQLFAERPAVREPVAPAHKEPWEMTEDEWIDETDEFYHGSSESFDVFDPKRSQSPGVLAYVSPEWGYANTYGEVETVRARVENPLDLRDDVLTDDGRDAEKTPEEWAEVLEERGVEIEVLREDYGAVPFWWLLRDDFSSSATNLPDALSTSEYDAVITYESHEGSQYEVYALVKPSSLPANHEKSVHAALRAGKPVPAEVLAEYPDLRGREDFQVTGEPSRQPHIETYRALHGARRYLKERGITVEWEHIRSWQVRVFDPSRPADERLLLEGGIPQEEIDHAKAQGLQWREAGSTKSLGPRGQKRHQIRILLDPDAGAVADAEAVWHEVGHVLVNEGLATPETVSRELVEQMAESAGAALRAPPEPRRFYQLKKHQTPQERYEELIAQLDKALLPAKPSDGRRALIKQAYEEILKQPAYQAGLDVAADEAGEGLDREGIRAGKTYRVDRKFQGEVFDYIGKPGDKGGKHYLWKHIAFGDTKRGRDPGISSWDTVMEAEEPGEVHDITDFLERLDRAVVSAREVGGLSQRALDIAMSEAGDVGTELAWTKWSLLKEGYSIDSINAQLAEVVQYAGGTEEDAVAEYLSEPEVKPAGRRTVTPKLRERVLASLDEARRLGVEQESIRAAGELASAREEMAQTRRQATKELEARAVKIRMDEAARWRRRMETEKLSEKEKEKRLREELRRIMVGQPNEVRGKVLLQAEKAKTPATLSRLKTRVEREREEYDRRQFMRKIEQALSSRPRAGEAGYVRGWRSPEGEAKLAVLRQRRNWTRERAVAAQQANIEAAERGDMTWDEMLADNELLNYAGVRELPLDQLAEMYDEILHIRRSGLSRAEGLRIARRHRIDSFVSQALQAVTGGKGLKPGTGTLDPRELEADRGTLDKLSNRQFGLENILDKLSALDRQSAPYESALSKFADMVTEARGAQEAGIREVMQEVLDGVRQSYGVETKREAEKILNDVVGAKHTIGTFTTTKGHKVTLTMTRGEAMKRYQEMQDPTLADTFAEGMHWTPEMRQAVKDFLSAEDKAWANWIMEFYQDYYSGVNKVYRQVYGVDLPHNRFYSPLSRDVSNVIPETLAMHRDAARYATASNRSLKARVQNIRPLRLVDANAVLVNHVAQMEHFKAFAEPVGFMREVLKDPDLRNAIIQYHGRDLLREVDQSLVDIGRDGVNQMLVVQGLERSRRLFTRGVLAAKPRLGMVQVPSFLAYMTEMPVKSFATGAAEFWKAPIKNFRALREKSPILRARWEKGFERDIRDAIKKKRVGAIVSRKYSLGDAFMLHVRAGDRLATMTGAWAAYKHGLKQGMGETEAVRFAERATHRTQPTAPSETLSTWQRSGSWMRLMTMFQNQPNKYYRIMADNFRNWRAGRASAGTALKNIFLAWVVLPSMFQFMTDGFRFNPKRQLRSWILGPLNKLLILGNLVDLGYQRLTGDSRWDWQAAPPIDTVNRLLNATERIGRLGRKGEWPAVDDTDLQRAIEDVLVAVGQSTGLPAGAAQQAARALREGEDLADFMDRFVFPGADRREEPRRREGFERYRSH